MDKQSRLTSIVGSVMEHGTIDVETIVRELGVSAATARRDLDSLADQQLLVRTRGGARSNPATGDVPLRYRTSRNALQKQAIARRAATMVSPGQVVGLNGGTTTTAIAQEIAVHAAADPRFLETPLTVVTNAVNIANDLTIRPQIRVVLTGGVARTNSFELVGPLAALILPEIHIDLFFLGVNAVDTARCAFYAHTEDEATINAGMMRVASRTVVPADASKIGRTAFARIGGFADASALITDARISSEASDRLRAEGVELILT